MLKKIERIKRSEQISLLLKKGCSVRAKGFMLKYLESQTGSSLFTVIVSKKLFKTVVQKNRYRRRGMALLAQAKNMLKKDHLMILMPGTGFLEADFAELQKDLEQALKKIGC